MTLEKHVSDYLEKHVLDELGKTDDPNFNAYPELNCIYETERDETSIEVLCFKLCIQSDADLNEEAESWYENHGITIGYDEDTIKAIAKALGVRFEVLETVAEIGLQTSDDTSKQPTINDTKMAQPMTVAEAERFLKDHFQDLEIPYSISDVDVGDFTAIVIEFDLPSEDSIRFAVDLEDDNHVTEFNIRQGLSFAMANFDRIENGLYYPNYPSDVDTDLVVTNEENGIEAGDAKYLKQISSTL